MAASNIPALVQCLRIGGGASRALAALALLDLAESSPERCQAITSAGGIPALQQLLCSSNDDAAQRAAAVLGILARFGGPRVKAAVASNGSLHSLLQLLGTSRSTAVQDMATASISLTALENPERCQAATAARAIPVLVHQLGSQHTVVQQSAAVVIAKVIWRQTDASLRASITASGAIAALVQLLRHSQTEQTQHSAALALSDLASDTPENQRAAAAAGGIPALVSVVHRLPTGHDEDLLRVVCRARATMASNPNSSAAVAAAGVIPALVQLLRSGTRSEAVQMEAAAALAVLCPQHRQAIAAAEDRGVVAPAMQNLLLHLSGDEEAGEVVQAAARNLSAVRSQVAPSVACE